MKEAYEYLLHEAGFKNKDSLVVAVSGGPDSMALLHLLVRLKEVIDINIICAHVNHNVRKESDSEKVFVEDYCNKNGVIFEYMKIENYGDDNFHNEAREKRYTYFETIINKYRASYLLTAHHGDDLMETILMRIVRGSTLRGYSGFAKELSLGSYKILRPLIFVTKDEIYDYIKDNKLEYVVDNSNFKEVYTRNRYRKFVLPFLKKEDSNVHKKFYKFSQTLLEYSNYIDLEVDKVFFNVFKNNTINISSFNKQHVLIQKEIINRIFKELYKDDLMLITDKHSDLILNLIKTGKSGSELYFPNNIVIKKDYDNLIIEELVNKEKSFEFELDKLVILPNGMKIEVVKDELSTSNYFCRLDSSSLKMPLHIRNRQNGDKIEVKGMKGSKKINDIFINSKVSKDKRDLYPVVLDSAGMVVWLPGLKKSKFDRTKDEKYDIILKYY